MGVFGPTIQLIFILSQLLHLVSCLFLGQSDEFMLVLVLVHWQKVRVFDVRLPKLVILKGLI